MTKLKTPAEKKAITLEYLVVGFLVAICITACLLATFCETPKPTPQVNPTWQDNFLNLK